jgi:hypothetical protein
MSEKQNGPVRSSFECASQNLRATLRYLHRDLQMPRETLRMQVDGILTSFAVEDAYEQTRRVDPKPQGPA